MALDLSGPKTPPPAKRSAVSQAKQAAQTNAKTLERQEGLEGLFQLGAGVSVLFGNFADAGACQIHGPAISQASAEFGERNERVGSLIDYIVAVGPYAGLLTAFMPFVLQILVNHKRLPAAPLAQFGVVSPEALAAKAEADLMRQQMEMMQEQQQAMQEMAVMQRDLAEANNKHSEPVNA